jgi:hypothetical protein
MVKVHNIGNIYSHTKKISKKFGTMFFRNFLFEYYSSKNGTFSHILQWLSGIDDQLIFGLKYSMLFPTFRFAFGGVGDSCPHFPTNWVFFSQTSRSFIYDPSTTVSCSPGMFLNSTLTKE